MSPYLDSVIHALTVKGWSASLLGSATVTATKRYDSIVVQCTDQYISAEISRLGDSLTYRPRGYREPMTLIEGLIEAFSYL